MSANQQWTGKTGGGSFGQRFLFFTLKRLKASTLYPFVFISIPFYLLFSRQAYRAINNYFRDILGYSRWNSFWKTAKNFYIFGQIVVDRFAIIAGNGKHFKIISENKEYVDRLFASDHPFIIASAHVGNLEMIGHQFQQSRKTIHCLAFAGETKNMQSHRSHSLGTRKSVLVPISDDMSHVFALKNALDNNDVITVLCDRSSANEKRCDINFLGRAAQFPLGSFTLAARFGVEMVAVFVMKERGMRYKLIVKPLKINNLEELSPKEAAQQLAEHYALELEKIVQEYPTQWFNFYNFWQKK